MDTRQLRITLYIHFHSKLSMFVVFITIITMLGCIQAEGQQHEQDLYNDLDIINSNSKAGDLAYKKLMSIQDKLEKALDSKTKELIESTDGLLKIILELMYTEYPYFSRRDYKNQLLNDVAEILVCDVKPRKPFYFFIEDEYCEEIEQGEAEREYLKNLQAYLKKKNRERIDYFTKNENGIELHRPSPLEIHYENGILDKMTMRPYRTMIYEKLNEILDERPVKVHYKNKTIYYESKEDRILIPLIFCRLATMKAEELNDFILKGIRLAGMANFVADLLNFIHSEDPTRELLISLSATQFESSLKEVEKLTTIKISPADRKTLFDILDEVVKNNPVSNKKTQVSEAQKTLSDATLNKFRILVIPKARAILREEVNLWAQVKNFVFVEKNPNKTIRITVDGTKLECICDVLTCWEKKIYEDFPIYKDFSIYEICFSNIDFSRDKDLSTIAHSFMKRFNRIRFEKCTFKEDKFNLSFLNFEVLSTIEELRIIDCSIKDIGFFSPLDNQESSCVFIIFYYLKLPMKPLQESKILKRLKAFEISSYKFSKIPKYVFRMNNLTELRIRNGKLKKVSNKIVNLKKLKTLSFSGNYLKSISTAITQIRSLKRLILRNNKLTSINKDINNLKNLEELILDNNNLFINRSDEMCFELPKLKYLSMTRCFNRDLSGSKCFSLFSEKADKCLVNLEKLDLSNCNLATFPKKMLMMKKLKTLILKKNSIDSNTLEDTLKSDSKTFPALKRLVLSRNYMHYFPPVILKITNLRELIMKGCNIVEIPDNIASLNNLTTLDISRNEFKQFPTEITKLPKLEYLDLSYNWKMTYSENSGIAGLQTLRGLKMASCNFSGDLLLKDICKLTNLEILDLSHNERLVLPKEIGNLVNLKELYVKGISINENPNYYDSNNPDSNTVSTTAAIKSEFLPAEISKLSNLELLDVSENDLSEIPAIICELTSLETLRINRIEIDVLPDEFSDLINLRELHMCANNFKEVPISICDLQSLEVLDVSNNLIVDLPSELKNLVNLETLDISRNWMNKIPAILWDLISLEKLIINSYLVDARDKMMVQMISKIPTDAFKRKRLKINQEIRPFIFLFPIEMLNQTEATRN